MTTDPDPHFADVQSAVTPPVRIAAPRLALTFILITVTLDAVGIGLIFPVMPDLIQRATGGTLSQAALWGGVLSTSFAVMQFLCGPTVGSLSDRFGRRPVLLISLAVMAVDYVVMGAATTIWLLLATRIIAGVTSATQSTASAFIADITAPQDRGRRFGYIGASFGVGFVMGPLVGGLLASIHLSAPFYAAGAMAAANLVLGTLVLPETVTDRTRRPFRWSRANPLGALLAVSRLPAMRKTLVTFLILAIATNVYPAIWSFFGKARFDWNTTMIGYSLALYGLSYAMGQVFLVGPLIARFGEHRAATGGMIVETFALIFLGFVTSGPLALFITPVTALGGIVTPALTALLSRATPDDAQGELQGVLSSLNAIAMIVAPLVMTFTFARFTALGSTVYSPGAPFLLAGLLMIGAISLHIATPRKSCAATD